MNARHKKRLLNVARALRESQNPRQFTMELYTHNSERGCGTPACALGHYASRRDLQKLIEIGRYPVFISYTDPLHSDMNYDDPLIAEHFGITLDEADALFSDIGCGGAKSAVGAARYIEEFVRKRARR